MNTSAETFALLRQVHLAELATQLEDMVTTEPPVPVADAIALCKAQKAEWNLPEVEILKVRAGAAPWQDEEVFSLMACTAPGPHHCSCSHWRTAVALLL
jgi:hypothetical protein